MSVAVSNKIEISERFNLLNGRDENELTTKIGKRQKTPMTLDLISSFEMLSILHPKEKKKTEKEMYF